LSRPRRPWVFSLQIRIRIQSHIAQLPVAYAPPDESARVAEAAVDELPAARARGAMAGEIEIELELALPERVWDGKFRRQTGSGASVRTIIRELGKESGGATKPEHIREGKHREDVVEQDFDGEIGEHDGRE
jgi:hypothetical protein